MQLITSWPGARAAIGRLLLRMLKFTNKLNSQKNNGLVSPIVYRIEQQLWTKGHATLILADHKSGLEAISLTELARDSGGSSPMQSLSAL